MKIKLDEGAFVPTRAHSTDAGLDLYSPVGGLIQPGDSLCIDTGVHVELPTVTIGGQTFKTAGMLKSKSGLNVKHGIQSEGVIDSGYTGSIVVKLYNHGGELVKIERGQKVSQLVLLPIITPELEIVDGLEDTERGDGGFGSTGR